MERLCGFAAVSWPMSDAGIGDWFSAFQRLEVAREESALILHHDAITGTARMNVYANYLEVTSLLSDTFQRTE